MSSLYALGPNFIIKDLPEVLILIFADHISIDSLCISYKYNRCLCKFIGGLYTQFLTLLMLLSEIYVLLLAIFWINLRQD